MRLYYQIILIGCRHLLCLLRKRQGHPTHLECKVNSKHYCWGMTISPTLQLLLQLEWFFLLYPTSNGISLLPWLDGKLT
jgi:hypothetical protein